MVDIFISYPQRERDLMLPLKRRLEALGLILFVDVDGRLDGDATFPEALDKGIRNAKAVLGCWSPWALTRDWVKNECAIARDQNKLVAVERLLLTADEVPVEFYRVDRKPLADFDGETPHEGWAMTLTALATKLRIWADKSQTRVEADEARAKADVLEKAASAERARLSNTQPTSGDPVFTERTIVARGTAERAWIAIERSVEASHYRRFEKTFENDADAFERVIEAEARAKAIERWYSVDRSDPVAIADVMRTGLFPALEDLARAALQAVEECIRAHETVEVPQAAPQPLASIADGERSNKAFRALEELRKNPRRPLIERFLSEFGDDAVAEEAKALLAVVPIEGRVIFQLQPAGRGEVADDLSFSRDGSRILLSSSVLMTQIFEAATGHELVRVPGGRPSLSPDGSHVLTVQWRSEKGHAYLWNARDGRAVRELKASGIAGASFSPDGNRVITRPGPFDKKKPARVWDVFSGRRLLEVPCGAYGTAEYSPDGVKIVAGEQGASIHVLDAQTGRELARLTGHYRRAQFCPVGTRLLVLPNDYKCAGIWDIGSQKESALLRHPDTVWRACFSPKGDRVATECNDGQVRLWDTNSGEKMTVLAGRSISGVSFAPTGDRLIGHSEGIVYVWDAESGRALAALAGASDRPHSSFSPDGKSFITPSAGAGVVWCFDAA